MTLAVTAPTGHIGSRVVRLLIQAGVRPVLLERHPEKIDVETRGLVEIRQGDQADERFVLEATRGVDALFWLDPPVMDGDDPIGASKRLGGYAARAVRDNGIARVVQISGLGAERRHGLGMIDGLAAVEEALDGTDADVLHLRCGYFFTNLLGELNDLRAGVIKTTLPPDLAQPWLDPRDIGDVAAARLLSTDWKGKATQAVMGPEDLSYSQVADILSIALGRVVRVEPQTDDEAKRDLLASGMGPNAAEAMVAMPRGAREGLVASPERSIVNTTPTTLAAWAYAVLRPALENA